MEKFHIHLVSDATGETVQALAKACLVQFDGVEPIEHVWTLVLNTRQVKEVIQGIEKNPGMVMFTMVNAENREILTTACRRLKVPSLSILQPIMTAFTTYLKTKERSQPGRQHSLDGEYFERITAMDYAMSHDDGQATWNLGEADVVIIGVSRTSKTPTSIYLANRGIKAANIPIVLGVPLPNELFELEIPLVVGLTNETRNLLQVRRNRLRMLNEQESTSYVDPSTVAEEVNLAKKLCRTNSWPVIDISRRSIEETAASIIKLLAQHRENSAKV